MPFKFKFNKKSNAERQDIYDRVTGKIVAALEQGTRHGQALECRQHGRPHHPPPSP